MWFRPKTVYCLRANWSDDGKIESYSYQTVNLFMITTLAAICLHIPDVFNIWLGDNKGNTFLYWTRKLRNKTTERSQKRGDDA